MIVIIKDNLLIRLPQIFDAIFFILDSSLFPHFTAITIRIAATATIAIHSMASTASSSFTNELKYLFNKFTS